MPSAEPLTTQAAARALKQFFETAPLLHPLEIVLEDGIGYPFHLFPDKLQMPCQDPDCSQAESTTWNRVKTDRVYSYRCLHCGRRELGIWIECENLTIGERAFVKSFRVIKVGQWPQWSPKLSKRLLKSLGSRAMLYRRGVLCLGEGFGIAACAYFRRVIEEETDEILSLIERAAQAEGNAETIASVIEAKEGKLASERLKLAGRKLPSNLRPGGANPLGVLFGAFSEGVHSLPEEEAVSLAQGLLLAFEFLFERVREQMDAAEDFARAISKQRS